MDSELAIELNKLHKTIMFKVEMKMTPIPPELISETNTIKLIKWLGSYFK